MHDLAVIIVSYGSARWLPACLETVYAQAGELDLDVVVVDNDPGDEVPGIVAGFPAARVIRCENRGFAAANNVGFLESDARYSLFLNPDTEIRQGTFADMVARLDRRPAIGVVGVRQVLPSGELFPTVRRFPSVGRAFAEALGVEKLSLRRLSLGERMLDLSAYGDEMPCDWTSGSFLLARREALLSAGVFDERFFLFSEEVDLCLRVRRAGWEIWHFPHMEIVHHSNKAGIDPRLDAQQAFARRQYACKHFSTPRRAAYLCALALRHGLRGVLAPLDRDNAEAWRATARRALPLILGRGEPPFGAAAEVALAPPAEVAPREPEPVQEV